MVLLGGKIGMGLLHKKIKEIAAEREEKYVKQMKEVSIKSKEGSNLLPDALDEITEPEKPEEPNWLTYGIRATKETDPKKIESTYKEGLEKCPNSPELMNDYAIFLQNIKRDYSLAEKYYLKALELDPNDAGINSNYALFLAFLKSDYSLAEKYYLKALELDPDDADINSDYALFLAFFKRDYPQAEEYYQKVLDLEPDDANINGNYALFLLQQGYFDQAKIFIDKAFQHIQPINKGLELELWFYRYACFYQDYPESKSKVESLLQDGIRSPGWPLEGLLETVKQIVQHPEYDQVAEFAKQISEV